VPFLKRGFACIMSNARLLYTRGTDFLEGAFKDEMDEVRLDSYAALVKFCLNMGLLRMTGADGRADADFVALRSFW